MGDGRGGMVWWGMSGFAVTEKMRGRIRLNATWVRWTAATVFAVGLAAVFVLLQTRGRLGPLPEWLREMGPAGMALFAGAYILATLLLLPGFIFTVAAGLIFGLGWGVVTISFASTAATALAFLIARVAARGRVAELARRYKKFDAVDRAIGEAGWRVVALMRLSPVLPFGLQNYLYGLSSIRFWPCVLTTWLAMLPGTLMYVYIGYLARAGVSGGADTAGVGVWALRVGGFAATLVATTWIALRARRKLREREVA